MNYDAPHTVYVHLDAAGGVLYVGCTMNLRERTHGHRSAAYWWPSVATVKVDSTQPNYYAGIARERELIAQYEPPHNRHANPARQREKDAWNDLARRYGIIRALELTAPVGRTPVKSGQHTVSPALGVDASEPGSRRGWTDPPPIGARQ